MRKLVKRNLSVNVGLFTFIFPRNDLNTKGLYRHLHLCQVIVCLLTLGNISERTHLASGIVSHFLTGK